jgi:hypothetical protein
MNSATNSAGKGPIPLWQQVLFCSAACASLALAAGYMLGKGSVTKAPAVNAPPGMTRIGGRLLPAPDDLRRFESEAVMPLAREYDLEQVSSDTTAHGPSETATANFE